MSDLEPDIPKERLRRRLREKEYREQYATAALIENFSEQVQALRRQRGLTQEELAEKIGTKQPRISILEAPPVEGPLPNWELDTLNRVAQALGTRLKISCETYGSLVEESESLTSDSLRRPEPENDAVLFPRPPMPQPDPKAPERTRWVQEAVIPWLWDDKLGLSFLIDWLQGRGLPPVGHDEEPYQWLLRGIPQNSPGRDYLEKSLAEKLAVLLGEQPDTHPLTSGGQEEFLTNLYWTCAGLSRPSFLAERLWAAYKRLKDTKLNGAVRDALQGALVQNQFGDKPLKEIWEPMVRKGKHGWLRGGEILGYEGILVRHKTVKPDYNVIYWALSRISNRWQGSPEQMQEFKRLFWKVPDLDRVEVARKLLDSAYASDGWSAWARQLLPLLNETTSIDGSIDLSMTFSGFEYFAYWSPSGPARTGIREINSDVLQHTEDWAFEAKPTRRLLINALLTQLSDRRDSLPELEAAHAFLMSNLLKPPKRSEELTVAAGPIGSALVCAEFLRAA
jgi:transcriptional regulator with XRE-family HTH domain